MNVNEPLVVVVIPNWNLRNDLCECLDSLRLSNYSNLHIIVVDNASDDDSVEYVCEHYPWVELLPRLENGGYAAALNDGICATAKLKPDFYLVLNNDTLVPSDTIGKIINIAQSDSRLAIVAPKILYNENPKRIFSLGDRIYPFLPLPIRYGVHAFDKSKYSGIMEFDYVFGCALLIRAKALHEVGLFDESFMMFYEDVDLCRRVRDAGWKIVRLGSAVIFHKASLSVKKQRRLMIYYRARNRSRFYRRYRHGPHPYLTFIALLIGSLMTLGKFFFSGRGDQITPYVKGAWDGFRNELPPISKGEELKR